jgi:hypothetical protein
VSKIVEFNCATDEGSNNEDDEDSDDSGDEDKEERCAFMRIFVIASFVSLTCAVTSRKREPISPPHRRKSESAKETTGG